jgi:hypothetical protein
MGGSIHKRKRIGSKKKGYKRALDTKRRPKDIDQIQVCVNRNNQRSLSNRGSLRACYSSTWIMQDELKLEKEAGKPLTFEYDDDLPG